MAKWMGVGLIAAGICSPALAQRLPDHPARQTREFDQTSIKDGLDAIGRGGECQMWYVVGKNGKAKHVVADCTVPDMAPYAVRAIEGAEWEPEVFAGKASDSDFLRAAFKFGIHTRVDPRGEKPPVIVRNVSQNELREAVLKVGGYVDRCDVSLTVGKDGKPRDVVTDCKPPTLDPLVAEVVGKMQYTPAQKAGRPTDWPGLSLPLEFKEIVKR